MMGEVAEMMLDGTICATCGELIDGEAPGYPRFCCEECETDDDLDPGLDAP